MYLAVDIGGSKTLIAVFDDDGKVVTRQKIETNPDYGTFVSELKQNMAKLSETSEITAVGVAVPGHLEAETGIVKGFGNLEWKNKDIAADLAELRLPIVLEHDAGAGALGEAHMGAGKGFSKVLYLTISTGIGMGVTVDGKIDPALKESEGGMQMLEHDGKVMLWEKFSSGKAFYEHYHKMGKDVDDPKIWEEFAQDLAQGLWNLITVVQPDIVVVGGSMGVHFAKYGSFLNDALASFEAATVDHPPVVQAKYPEDAVINGCYQAAKQYASGS